MPGPVRVGRQILILTTNSSIDPLGRWPDYDTDFSVPHPGKKPYPKACIALIIGSSVASDRFRNPKRPLSLGRGNWSSCPIPVIARRSPTGAGIGMRPTLGRRLCPRTVVQFVRSHAIWQGAGASSPRQTAGSAAGCIRTSPRRISSIWSRSRISAAFAIRPLSPVLAAGDF